MSPSVEIFGSEQADVHISPRTEGNTDELVGFYEHRGHLYGCNREWIIDESLAVAYLKSKRLISFSFNAMYAARPFSIMRILSSST